MRDSKASVIYIYIYIYSVYSNKMIILFKYCTDVKNCESFRGFGYFILFLYMYIYVCVDERVLGSKTLGSKCIRTLMCNVDKP